MQGNHAKVRWNMPEPQRTELRLRALGQAELMLGSVPPPQTQASLPEGTPTYLNDVVCCRVQARAVELQAWSMVACLIAFLCHRLQQQKVGTTAPVRSGEEHSGPGRGRFPPGEGPCLPEGH